LSDVDTHSRTGRLLVPHRIFFHGNKCSGLHGVCRAVGEGDAGRAVGGGLDLIALVQRGVEIRVDPLDGIDFLDLHFSVKVDELGLHLRNGCGFAVTVAY